MQIPAKARSALVRLIQRGQDLEGEAELDGDDADMEEIEILVIQIKEAAEDVLNAL